MSCGAIDRDRGARAARAPGAAGAVHVALGALGEVEVDDVREVRDVDAARGDVGRDRKRSLPSRVRAMTCSRSPWGKVAVEPRCAEALALERLGDALGLGLGVAEDDRALGVLDLENAKQRRELVAAREVDVVQDLERADVVARERDELGLASARSRAMRSMSGGMVRREEQRLAALGAGARGCSRARARSPSRASRRPRRARACGCSRSRACRAAGDRARGRACPRRPARPPRARRPGGPSARRRRWRWSLMPRGRPSRSSSPVT